MGTSGGTGKNRHRGWDHPHAYGDKGLCCTDIASHVGSSPRVWGQDYSDFFCVIAPGIIPTRMGTSLRSTGQRHEPQDHPHAYGDKTLCRVCVWDAEGSSPRVWGQVLIRFLLYSGFRIIPTRMGTRKIRSMTRYETRDHPHAYGDKSALALRGGRRQGSSPRVWGQDTRQGNRHLS